MDFEIKGTTEYGFWPNGETNFGQTGKWILAKRGNEFWPNEETIE